MDKLRNKRIVTNGYEEERQKNRDKTLAEIDRVCPVCGDERGDYVRSDTKETLLKKFIVREFRCYQCHSRWAVDYYDGRNDTLHKIAFAIILLLISVFSYNSYSAENGINFITLSIALFLCLADYVLLRYINRDDY